MAKSFSSPKDALLAYGRIDAITRGRISKDNNAWLNERIAAGEFTVSGIVVKSSTGPTPEPERVKSSETGVVDVRPPTRDEKAMQAFIGKDDIGMRAVCENCTSSLNYCPCESPRVRWNGSLGVVEFKARTKPLPINPWG